MSPRALRKHVSGEGVILRKPVRRRHEDDSAALLDARGAAPVTALDVAVSREPAALTEMLAHADTTTRARTIVGLQRVQGNAHVQRLLQHRNDISSEAYVRREPAVAAETAPILTSSRFKNDGVLEGVLHKKVVLDISKNGGAFEESIRKVQQALIDGGFSIPAGATGHYGQQTTKAVADFQRSLGLVDDGRVGANTMRELDERFADPGPQPNPNPQPGPNPKTAAALDAVLVQYQFMLTRQRDALQAVRRDLGNLDKPKAPFEVALVEQFLKSFLAFYYGIPGGIFVVAIDKALKGADFSEDARKAFEEANGKLFESLGLPERTAKAIEDPQDALATLDEWFDLRLRVLTENVFKSELVFVNEVKPLLLNQTPAAVEEWRKSVGPTAEGAYDKQYEQELNDWASYQAKAQLKKTTATGGTNLSGATEDAAGVLELVLHGGSPEQGFPVKITSARITGFSERTRRKLAKQPIERLSGIPIAARGTVVAKGARGHISIGRNENGEFFSWDSDARGEFWLKFRAAARDKPGIEFVTPEDIERAKPEDGAQGVFGRDLDVVKPRDVEGGLESA